MALAPPHQTHRAALAAETLAPMLVSIHNLHYYQNLMREIREALEAGTFSALRERFKADRVRGV